MAEDTKKYVITRDFDKIANAIYIGLKKGKVSKTIKLKDRLVVDVDKTGKILGIEILDATAQISRSEINKMRIGIPVLAR